MKRLGQMHTEDRPCEDTGRRQPSANQGEMPQKTPTLLAPWSWTSSLQNYEKTKFCCLSPSVCGPLLWRPEQSQTLSKSSLHWVRLSLRISFCFGRRPASWEQWQLPRWLLPLGTQLLFWFSSLCFLTQQNRRPMRGKPSKVTKKAAATVPAVWEGWQPAPPAAHSPLHLWLYRHVPGFSGGAFFPQSIVNREEQIWLHTGSVSFTLTFVFYCFCYKLITKGMLSIT